MLQQETDNYEARPETSNTNDASHSIFLKPSSSTSTSATTPSWSRFKDPRVVRVSKALGGKDRHSKVCTVRGLRDRRVRLSVPTAIQLYDLQERLGLNQPSKAVDWLLNAAKNEINELPPLQIPPGMINFGQNNNHNNNNLPILDFQEFRSDKQGVKIDRDENIWARNQEERQFHQLDQNSSNAYNSSYNSNFRLDHSNLSLSNNPRMAGQHEDWYNNFGLLPFQPTLSTVVPSHHHQVFVYHNQPETSTQSYFPSSELTVDSTNSQPLTRHVHFNMTANLLPSQDNNNGNR